MKKLTLALLTTGFLVTSLLGQTAEKLANINKKVVGKWVSSDGKNYIEFSADGVCSEGALFPDGQWHIQKGQLSVWQQGVEFSCFSGALTLVGPNKLTRDYGMGGDVEKYYRGSQNRPKGPGPLTLAVAQRILVQQINVQTAKNTLITCHACYDPSDKDDNDRALLVSTYDAALGQFLRKHGYIRTSGEQEVFTAKAKRSKYYKVEGLAGIRFANFKNPRILASKIVDPSHVPVEYDFVPTELTMGVYHKIVRVKSFASFTYGNEAWRMCLACPY